MIILGHQSTMLHGAESLALDKVGPDVFRTFTATYCGHQTTSYAVQSQQHWTSSDGGDQELGCCLSKAQRNFEEPISKVNAGFTSPDLFKWA